MQRLMKVAIAVAALAMAVFVTGPKLVKMAKIRGFLPGAVAAHETVVEKWHQTPDQHPSGRNTYWVTWSRSDIRQRGDHRINLTRDRWNGLRVGDPIEIVRMSSGEPFLRDGIFASNGNLLFDALILVSALGIAAWGFLSRSEQ